jgi:DNA-binding MarR family transcriptional regulator
MGQDIYQEIRQSKPFDSLEQEVYVNLMRTAAVLSHRFGTHLKPFSLTSTQFNVLRILRGAGRAGLPQTDIRERLISQVPDIPRLLRRLELLGYIRQERSTVDRRHVSAFITPHGRTALTKVDRILHQAHKELLSHMKTSQLRQLNDLLNIAR